MEINDKEFIREIVSSDFKPVSNPDFTRDTLKKIAELEDKKPIKSNSGDPIFLIPQFIYVSVLILFSLVAVIISWTQPGEINAQTQTVEMISGILFSPVTVSILFSFSLLYVLDLFLKRVKT
jgi:hypothetical protein